MNTPHSLYVITTPDDISAPLFTEQSAMPVVVARYTDDLDALIRPLTEQQHGALYLRDPFNTDTFDPDLLSDIITKILAHTGSLYVVDHLKSFDEVLFEDKWNQYQTFAGYMPATRLLTPHDTIPDAGFIKKRISSRARGVVFSPEQITEPHDHYIVQEPLSIEKEFRVFVVCKDIQQQVSIRSSKTEDTKVKTAATESISPELHKYVEQIVQQIPFDFVGLDIAQTPDGFSLIEVNRSPQFNAYHTETGINLAQVLCEKLTQL